MLSIIFFEKAGVFYELSDWGYSKLIKLSKELITDLSLVLSEITEGLIEDDDTLDYFLNGKKYRRLPIENKIKYCTCCDGKMKHSDDYGSDSSGQKLAFLCSSCIKDGVPSEYFKPRIDSWYKHVEETYLGGDAKKIIDNILNSEKQ